MALRNVWLHRAKTLLRGIVYMRVCVCVSMSQCFFAHLQKQSMCIVLYVCIYIYTYRDVSDGCLKATLQPADRRNNSCEKSPRRERIRRERVREESQQERRSQQQSAREGRKVRNTVFSQVLWLRRLESRLAKAANAEPSGCTPLWREAYLSLAAFFGKPVVEQSACECGAKQISKSKC